MWKHYQKLLHENRIEIKSPDFPKILPPKYFIYPKNMVPVVYNENSENYVDEMYWDLIPRWYQSKENLSVEEVIKRKNSVNSRTFSA